MSRRRRGSSDSWYRRKSEAELLMRLIANHHLLGQPSEAQREALLRLPKFPLIRGTSRHGRTARDIRPDA